MKLPVVIGFAGRRRLLTWIDDARLPDQLP